MSDSLGGRTADGLPLPGYYKHNVRAGGGGGARNLSPFRPPPTPFPQYGQAGLDPSPAPGGGLLSPHPFPFPCSSPLLTL